MPYTHELVDKIYEEVLHYLNPEALYEKEKKSFIEDLQIFIEQYGRDHQLNLTKEDQDKIAKDLSNDFFGFGPLEYLLKNPDITEIMVNRPDQIYIEKGGILSLTPIHFRSKSHIINVAQRIATMVHRRIDNANPLLDARLPDGSRVNAVLDPVSLDSPTITIRKFSKDLLTIEKLINWGALTEQMARFLEICTRCGVNIIVGGGTGAGKTTLLNVLSQMINPDERVITIEDSAELQLQSENLIRLETRAANAEGKGEVLIYDLIKNCLRMRPDRIIVGEVRGSEVYEMLKVLNTGHDGSMSTIHCNNAQSALLRIENMVATSNPGINSQTIRSQIASAIDLVVYVKRFRDGSRRVTEILDVRDVAQTNIQTEHLFNYKVVGETKGNKVDGYYETQHIIQPSFIDKVKAYNLHRELINCLKQGVSE